MAGKNQKTSSIWLDYREAATRKLLCNISTATMAGPYLWTASDEGRTVECLEPHKDGFRLRQQIRLDDVFASLPGRANHDEADIEAISVSRGMLWICGSHSRVRRNRVDLTKVDPRFRSRPSRCLLGVVALKRNGGGIAGPGAALPFRGIGSLRTILSANAYIAPFVNLPNKENGLEIEGLCVSGRRLFLGLRGPLVDSIAIAIELKATPQAVGKHGKPITHFLDLDGLGIRDLAVHGAEIIVLAGPVSAANGPFRLYRWRPRQSEGVQHPRLLKEWLDLVEHPEGVCVLSRSGKKGLLIVYDTPDKTRIDKSRYRADWIVLAEFGRKRV